MRPLAKKVLDAVPDYVSVGGTPLPAAHDFRASVQAVTTGSSAAGTIELQGSNELSPLNWSKLGSAVAISGAGSVIVPAQTVNYQWLRAYFTSTAPGEQLITTVADTTGVAEITQITCIADPGVIAVSSITCPAKAAATGGDYVIVYRWTGQAFAVALNVSGIDPDPTGALWLSVGMTQRVNVDISGAVTADDVANLVRTNLLALLQFDGTCSAVVAGAFTVTQAYASPQPANISKVADDSGPGSITAAAPSPQGVLSLNNTYYHLYSAHDLNHYYVWHDVNGWGVDPALGGGAIGIQVPITLGDSAANISTASLLPIQNITGGVPFATVNSGDDTLIYNQQIGAATDCSDGAVPTGFTFLTTFDGVNQGPTLLNNTYFFLTSALDANKYVVWFNVGGAGSAPTVAGYTAEAVAITANDTAAAVAIALQAVLDPLTGIISAVASPGVVTADNTAPGAFTPAHDSVAPTQFTFALDSASNGTVTVNMKTLGA